MLRRLPAACRLACLAACLSAVLPRAAEAGEGDRVDFKYMYYWDRNGVWNHTPAFLFVKGLAEAWSVRWQQEADFVSGASRRLGLRNIGRQGDNVLALDAVNGASRREVRHSEKATVGYAMAGRAASASFYFSDEDDYRSYSPALGGSWDFNDRNTTLGGDLAVFFDDLHPQGAFRGLGGSRTLTSGSLSLSQILSRRTLATLTVNSIHSQGYLGHPYNPVILANGSLVLENLPDDKTSVAVLGQLIQGFRLGGRLGSARVEARYYRDSWRLDSRTVDAQVYWHFAGSAWLRLRCRGYDQGAAAFAKAGYAGDERYLTADSRYAAFSSLTFGWKLGSDLFEAWSQSSWLPDRWDIGYDHVVQDTEGDEGLGAPYRQYRLFPHDEAYLQGTFMLGLGFDL